MNPLPAPAPDSDATTCSFCGVWYLKEADALHSCEGEIKVRDAEIARLRNALENIRDGLSISGAALVIAEQAVGKRSTPGRPAK